MYGNMSPRLMQGSFENLVPLSQMKYPFLAMLNLLVTRLTNDLINHQAGCSVIPTKLPSDTPKFDGKPREDPSTHVMTFHLWCSSNCLNGDSICLRLFQCTLTRTILSDMSSYLIRRSPILLPWPWCS